MHILLCCDKDFSANWSVSSTSSEDDEEKSDANNNNNRGIQFHPARNNRATRVFYRNRSDRQGSSEIGSDTDARQQNVTPTRKSDTVLPCHNVNRGHKPDERLKDNKLRKLRSDGDTIGGSRSADVVDVRNAGEGRTSKHQRAAATNSDAEKSKPRGESDGTRASLKLRAGPREDEPAEWSGTGDQMRYSKNRRRPGKWKLLQIPGGRTYSRHAAEGHTSSGPPPADDRRPYQRNLPPRLLARLKQTHPRAATKDSVDSVSNTADSQDSNIEVDVDADASTAAVGDDATNQQDHGEIIGQDYSSISCYYESRICNKSKQ